MLKHFIPSLCNLLGILAGLLAVSGDALISHRAFGNHRILNDTIVGIASEYGFDAFTVAMIIGALIALVVSFIVTHIAEKLIRIKGLKE